MGSPADGQLITRDEAIAAESQNVFEAKIDLTERAVANDQGARNMLAFAQAYDVIDAADVCEMAADELTKIKKRITALNDERMSETRLLDQLKQKIMARYRPAISILEQARDYLQPRINRFLEDQEAKRKAEEARLRAAQLAEQKRMEAEAAERRRIAEEEARAQREAAAKAQREADEKAREQERQAAALRQQGEADAARASEAEAQRLRDAAAQQTAAANERATEIVDEGNRDAEQLQQAAAVVPAAVVAQTKVAGAVRTGRWCAEINPEFRDPLIEICKHVIAHPEDATALLSINWPGANQIAVARKERFSIPGLKAVQKFNVSSRGGKG